VDDWIKVNRQTPRLVDALPNGPRHHPTVQVFMAGGVPEVMLHLRDMGLLNEDVMTVTGEPLSAALDWWRDSERRRAAKERLRQQTGVDPERVIMSADRARREGLTSTVVFPRGNVAPEGSVVKATAIDPALVGADQVFRHRGPARVFTSEESAVATVKGLSPSPLKAGDVVVLIGCGPMGTGMEETYQLTSALKHVPWGRSIPILTDARFSGVSTGACIGHIGPEALVGGPIGKIRDGDLMEIIIDRAGVAGSVNLVGTAEGELTPEGAARLLEGRSPHPGLAPHRLLPDDTRLWAVLQHASGGTWGGCVYDFDQIAEKMTARGGLVP